MNPASGGLKRGQAESHRDGMGAGGHMPTSHAERAGTVTFEGDHATISLDRRNGHPIEEVWNAITDAVNL